MSITASLARQSAIARANAAEYSIIRGNQAQQDLIGSKGDLGSIARKETQIELERIKAQTKAQAARAEAKALKSKRHKLDVQA